jgi:hypothetical protein
MKCTSVSHVEQAPLLVDGRVPLPVGHVHAARVRQDLVFQPHVSAIRPYDERRLSVRFADGSKVVSSRAGSQSLRKMVR